MSSQFVACRRNATYTRSLASETSGDPRRLDSVQLQSIPVGWAALCTLFGHTARPDVHVTLGYPSAPLIDMPEIGDLFDGVPLPDGGVLREVRWIATPLGDPVYTYNIVERWGSTGAPESEPSALLA